MALTYTSGFGLRKSENGDTSWGADERTNFDALDLAHRPTSVYFVSPAWTTAALGCAEATDRRHFDTLQGAIDAFETDEGDAADYGAIMVYPAQYAENLTIAKRVGFYSMNPVIGAVASGGSKPAIVGDGSAAPVITFDADAGLSARATFHGFSLRNSYNGNTGTELSWAYLLNTVDQGAANYGAYSNRIKFQHCDFRFTSVSDNDAWTSAFNVNAFYELKIHDCQINPMGGAANYILSPFLVRGNQTTAEDADLILERTRFMWWGVPTESGDYLIDMDDGSNCQVYDCAFNQDRADNYNLGSTGTNTIYGMASDADALAWKNTFGISAVTW